MTEENTSVQNSKCHVVFLHNKLKKAPEDRYIIDLANGLKHYGHEVTILTSYLDTNNCYEEVHPEIGALNVRYSGWFLPKRWFILKAIIMAIRMCVFPPKPWPKVVILDTNTISLLILSKLTSYKTIFLTHFSALKELDYFSNYMKVTPDLFTAKTIRYANDVVVQTECLGEVFKRSFPNFQKELKYICPCIDTGAWLEECLDITRIVPDLPKNCHLYVVFGSYKKRSNFRLALDAFENLLMIAEDALKDKLHLIIGGNCSEKRPDEMIYYDELMDMMKEKTFGSQITFLKDVSVVQKKTLLKKCMALLAPAKHDFFPDSVLEALAMGKPVIATNSGFARTVVTHRISGILVDADPYKFAAAMHKVLVNPMVQLFISEMAADLYRNKFSFEVLARKINNLVVKYVNNGVSFQDLK